MPSGRPARKCCGGLRQSNSSQFRNHVGGERRRVRREAGRLPQHPAPDANRRCRGGEIARSLSMIWEVKEHIANLHCKILNAAIFAALSRGILCSGHAIAALPSLTMYPTNSLRILRTWLPSSHLRSTPMLPRSCTRGLIHPSAMPLTLPPL